MFPWCITSSILFYAGGVHLYSVVRLFGEKTEEMEEIGPVLEAFCARFGSEIEDAYAKRIYVLVPGTNNPYKSLYTPN